MIEVVPGIRQWSRFSEEKGLDFNGLIIREGSERVLVDPPAPEAADEAVIRSEGPVTAVILTNLHHARSAAIWRERDGARLLAPAADRDAFSLPVDGTFGDGDRLPGGLRAIALDGMKTPGETALLHSGGGGTMILGDALIGSPPGALRLLPLEKIPDPDRARTSLRRLLGWPWEALLLGDGASIPKGGRAALERFLGSPA